MDERAFQSLYNETAAPLQRYAARVLGDAALAEDIVQEAWLRLLRQPTATVAPGGERAYLFRVVSNLMIDHWRRHKREVMTGEVPERSAADRDAALRLDMGQLFLKLTPRERQLLWLAHVEESEHREIAAALDLGEGSIRVLLSRARRKLAGLLRAGGHGTEKR